MNKTEKESKLRGFAKSVISNSKYKNEIKYILNELNLSEEEVIQAYINYDLDVFTYSNEVYESLAMRVVLHLHNLLTGSWHQDRQRAIFDMLKDIKTKSIVDVGFGVPTRYVREYILKDKDTRLTLVDLYESAFIFSKALLQYLDPDWQKTITFKESDMDTQEFVGEFNCYIFQDSIEHTKKPTDYLQKTIKLSPSNAKFVMSIPIGSPVPVHYIAWRNKNEAKEWLQKCGLKVDKSEKVFVNPEVDLFAEQLGEEFYNLIVQCSKIVQASRLD